MSPETNPAEGKHFAETRVFESVSDNVAEAEAWVVELLGADGWNEDQMGQFNMAVREAVVNAMHHGNDWMADKKATVGIDLDAERIRVTVTDEGEGFDPNAVADPRSKENLLNTSGRGTLMMREFSDECEWSNGGRTVILTKYKDKKKDPSSD